MRLLIVEDHEALAGDLALGFREEGFAVDLAHNGAEAEHSARSVQYDCIVLDIMLPGKDGWAVLSELRKHGVLSPVLCLTARDGVDDRVRGLNLGADDYLPKPFAWAELLARVRALVRRGHRKADPVISVGDLRIDTGAKTVSRAGRSIELTAREYSLLELLALKQGNVVSRSYIWEHLYDWADESSSNVIDVYVGYLRAKVDRDFPVKLLHTRRGQGYVLGTPSEAAR
jgi:DNA-binding response OmpR family regulator